MFISQQIDQKHISYLAYLPVNAIKTDSEKAILMVVLSLQTVQLTPQSVHLPALRYKPYTTSGTHKYNNVRCGIAEPSGEPAPFGEKTKYNDGFFEKAFMTLFARKMERFAAAAPAAREKKKGLWDCDYESFVDVSKRVMQGRSRMQQQEVVREVLLSMLPPGAPAQVDIIYFIFNIF